MNTPICSRGTWREKARALCFTLLLCLGMPANAGPGEHGPGGEHLDTPGTHGARLSATPRLETSTDLFELVSVLGGGELSTLINRFETTEPVLNATVEVALGTLKAAARFHADHGDYAVDDPGFLKALSTPGDHSLIFTIVAGKDSDLLEGTLTVKAVAGEHATSHSHFIEYSAIAAAVLITLTIAYAAWRRRSRVRSGYEPAGRLQ